MKKILLVSVLFLTLLGAGAGAAHAQGTAKTGPAPETVRDPDVEKDAMHNLEVARHYFKLKKAYVAALQRCEEIIAGNPTFSKIDEVLFLAGASSINLAQNKGKQNPSSYIVHEGETKRTLKPEEFRELARGYFSQLVNDYPDSMFRKQAEEDLKAVGGLKAKDANQ